MRSRNILGTALSAILILILTPVQSATSSTKKNELKNHGPVILDGDEVALFRAELNAKDGKALNFQMSGVGATGAANDELRLLAAEALVKSNYTLSAQIVLMDVASRSIGTSQGAWALHALDQLAQNVEVDESAIEELAYEFDSTVDSPSESSMLAWFRAKALLRRGYTEWASTGLDKIGIETRWHSDRLFERATDVLAEGKVDEAEALYENLLKRTNVRVSTREFAELNRARLIFEKGDYEETLKTVRPLNLPLRERARALLEMAWSRYYLKEYGKALGILKVVDSAFFESLRSPEADLLRMVIERDLCRYDLIKLSAAGFRARYKQAFNQIGLRLNLEDDAQLKQMALQNRLLQKRATLIHRYRTERKAIYDEDIQLVPGLREKLLQKLLVLERKNESEIARVLPRALERVAGELIDIREQVSFLEYEASIRPLTAAPAEEVDYRPEAASNTRFEKLYWPVVSEAWWDELDNYEVLIRARCAQPLPFMAPVRRKAPAPVVEEEEEEEEEEE